MLSPQHRLKYTSVPDWTIVRKADFMLFRKYYVQGLLRPQDPACGFHMSVCPLLQEDVDVGNPTCQTIFLPETLR